MEYITEPGRIYAVNADDKVIAEVTFPLNDGICTIDHTFVDPSLRGRGVASELVKLAADKILADGHGLAASCPYAVLWLKRHTEYPLAHTEAPVACRLDCRH